MVAKLGGTGLGSGSGGSVAQSRRNRTRIGEGRIAGNHPRSTKLEFDIGAAAALTRVLPHNPITTKDKEISFFMVSNFRVCSVRFPNTLAPTIT